MEVKWLLVDRRNCTALTASLTRHLPRGLTPFNYLNHFAKSVLSTTAVD